VIASAHLMAVLDASVTFVALPSAQHSLGLTVTTRQWVVTAYTLALAGLLLLGGRLADRLGARHTLLIGVAGFALASAAGGASADGAMLIAARTVQAWALADIAPPVAGRVKASPAYAVTSADPVPEKKSSADGLSGSPPQLLRARTKVRRRGQ
jgi:MFS family permease